MIPFNPSSAQTWCRITNQIFRLNFILRVVKVATDVYEQVILSRWFMAVSRRVSKISASHFSVTLTLSPDLESGLEKSDSKTSILIPAGDFLNFRFSHPSEFLFQTKISAQLTFEPFKTQTLSYDVKFKTETSELDATCWLESDPHQKILINML